MVTHQWPVALVVIWHIYSCLAWSFEDSARDLPSSGKVILAQGQVPCEFQADCTGCSLSEEEFRQGSFQPCPAQDGASSMAFGSEPDLAHLLHLYCSSRDGGRDLPSSGEAAPTMGKIPCEFRVDWPTFIFQLVAPDVIWHIYSHLYCSSRDGGRDLLSSGKAAPTMGKVPCEFWVDWPKFIFQPVAPDVILAHLLTLLLLLKAWWQGLAVFREGSPYHGEGPLWV